MWYIGGINAVWVGPYQHDICSGGFGVGWTVQCLICTHDRSLVGGVHGSHPHHLVRLMCAYFVGTQGFNAHLDPVHTHCQTPLQLLPLWYYAHTYYVILY